MLFSGVLSKKLKHLARQSVRCAQKHCVLSYVWARTLLGKKEAAFLSLVLIGGLCSTDYFLESGIFLIAIANVGMLFVASKRYRPSIVCLIAYIQVTSLFSVLIPTVENTRSQLLALGLILLCWLLVNTAWVLSITLYRLNMTVLGAVCLVSALLTLVRGVGLVNVSSLNAAILAALLPIVPVALMPLPLLAIFSQEGALAYGILGLHLFVLGATRWNRWKPALLLLPAFCIASYFWLPVNALFYEDRVLMYERALRYWWDTAPILGNGLGTYLALGPPNPLTGEHWPALHSDWIQGLFEIGALGMAYVFWVFGDFLFRNWKSSLPYCMVMLGFGACAVFYHPIRVPAVFFCIAVLTAEGLLRE